MKYWRRNRTHRSIGSKSYFSQKEIDFTSSNFNPEQFLLQEFFKINDSTLERILGAYGKLHGLGAASYFKRRIVDWRNGSAAVTDLMKRRILELMPRYLNEEKKFHLLKFEVTNQINRLQGKYRNNTINLADIEIIYHQEMEQINAIKNISLSWFTNNGIFTEEEKSEFLEISKFILSQRLHLSFNQVKRDFELISSMLSQVNRSLEEAVYVIDYLNCRVNLGANKIQINFSPLVRIELATKELKSKYKPYIEKYIFYELNRIQYIKLKSEVESFLTENDFGVITEHYHRLLSLDQEGDIKSTFKGEGGILTIFLEVKSLRKIKHDYIVSILQLIGFSIFCIILVYLFIGFNWINEITIVFGIIFISFAYSFLNTKLKEINKLQSDLKKHGRQ